MIPILAVLLCARQRFSTKLVYNYTGAQQSLVLPNGIFTIRVKLWGGGGAGGFVQGLGGGGGFVLADIAVNPGDTLLIDVGGGAIWATSTPGWPDGGNITIGGGGPGGGSTRVRIAAADVGAGGGGGAADGNGNPASQGFPGGTATGASPTGGGGGGNASIAPTIGGAGGLSSTTGGTATTVTGGTNQTPGNTGDADYAGNAGLGGPAASNGNNGLAVVFY